MANRNIGVPVLAVYLLAWWGAIAWLLVMMTSNSAPGAPTLKWRDDGVVTTTTKLVALVDTESIDKNGDKVTYTYRWYKNGELVPESAGKSIKTQDTLAGESWEVVVTPDDGTSGGGWMCDLPWRECAGDPAKDARISATVENSPARPRIRFVDDEEVEPEKFTDRDDVHLSLSCNDADFVDQRRRALVAAKAAGQEVPKADPDAPDPCTYTISWYMDEEPVEGEEEPEVTDEEEEVVSCPESEYTETVLPSKATEVDQKWNVCVIANDGVEDGVPVFELVEIEEP